MGGGIKHEDDNNKIVIDDNNQTNNDTSEEINYSNNEALGHEFDQNENTANLVEDEIDDDETLNNIWEQH